MKFLVFLAAILAVSNAEVIVSGTCGDLEVVKNFDISSYVGLWHQTHRIDNDFEPNADCVTAQYTPRTGNDSSIDVLNTLVIKNIKATIKGEVKAAENANGTAKLLVKFPLVGDNFTDYWVLSTDYKSYSLVVACWDQPQGNQKKLVSWILSRTKNLASTSVTAMTPAFQNAGLSWQFFEETNQTPNACKTLN